jgi:F420H(2)-dependent quinone reductase
VKGVKTNQFVERIVRAGIGGPCNIRPFGIGSGFVIVETTGRKTGLRRTVPLLAQRFGNTVVVSTVRTKSQWVRNVEVDAAPSVYVDGKSRPAKAVVRRLGDWTVVRFTLLPNNT